MYAWGSTSTVDMNLLPHFPWLHYSISHLYLRLTLGEISITVFTLSWSQSTHYCSENEAGKSADTSVLIGVLLRLCLCDKRRGPLSFLYVDCYLWNKISFRCSTTGYTHFMSLSAIFLKINNDIYIVII